MFKKTFRLFQKINEQGFLARLVKVEQEIEKSTKITRSTLFSEGLLEADYDKACINTELETHGTDYADEVIKTLDAIIDKIKSHRMEPLMKRDTLRSGLSDWKPLHHPKLPPEKVKFLDKKRSLMIKRLNPQIDDLTFIIDWLCQRLYWITTYKPDLGQKNDTPGNGLE